MASFQLGDDASTFNEMRDKIDRRAAAAEAKLATRLRDGGYTNAGD